MPELIRNTPPDGPDPTTLSTTDLAEQATHTHDDDSDDSDGGTTPITLTTAARTIPAQLLAAYQQAARQLTTTTPGCHLPWELLAAIGKVESGHAQGRPITADGTITRPILGPRLDGTGGTAVIRDTDNGTLDHDTTYDRAVGPMQFIPTTWATSGRDGNSDGTKNPHNIHDADLAAAHYLCARNRDLSNPTDLRAAILSYNPSDAYVRTVLTWLAGYRQTGATPQTGTGSTGGSDTNGTGTGGSTTSDGTGASVDDISTDGSVLGDIPIVELTPTRRPTSPTSPAPTTPTSGPSATPPGPVPSRTPEPDREWDLEACDPLRAADLAVTVTDLDPAAPGAEALDLTTTRIPWRAATIAVEATATATDGTPVAATSARLRNNQDSPPALLVRIPGASLADATLPDGTLLLTVKVNPADQHCQAHIRLRIRNIHPAAFAPRSSVPVTTPPTAPEPTVPAPPSTSPASPPSATAPPTPDATSAAPPAPAPSPSAAPMPQANSSSPA